MTAQPLPQEDPQEETLIDGLDDHHIALLDRFFTRRKQNGRALPEIKISMMGALTLADGPVLDDPEHVVNGLLPYCRSEVYARVLEWLDLYEAVENAEAEKAAQRQAQENREAVAVMAWHRSRMTLDERDEADQQAMDEDKPEFPNGEFDNGNHWKGGEA